MEDTQEAIFCEVSNDLAMLPQKTSPLAAPETVRFVHMHKLLVIDESVIDFGSRCFALKEPSKPLRSFPAFLSKAVIA